MKQDRNQNQDVPSRSSNMEPADDAREASRGNESMRNSGSSGKDLGTSSDRAMFSDDLPSDRRERESGRDSRQDDARGRGSEGERNRGAGGGISNRERDREQSEQDMLPPRGRSQSER
jgi:hypothetical protein